MIQAVPYTLHTVLTDNGIQFTNRSSDRYAFVHLFSRLCEEHGIQHRLTKVKHPWTNGQVERMNRTIKQATVKRFHYDDHAQLQQHLPNFIDAYNYGCRLKALKGLTPYEFICKQWTSEPERFKVDPIHLMPGLNSGALGALRRLAEARIFEVCITNSHWPPVPTNLPTVGDCVMVSPRCTSCNVRIWTAARAAGSGSTVLAAKPETVRAGDLTSPLASRAAAVIAVFGSTQPMIGRCTDPTRQPASLWLIGSCTRPPCVRLRLRQRLVGIQHAHRLLGAIETLAGGADAGVVFACPIEQLRDRAKQCHAQFA